MSEKESRSNKAQVSFWVSTAVAIIMFVALVGAIRNLRIMEELAMWQRVLPPLAISGTVIAALVSMWLCRQERSALGITLILAGMMITTITIPLVVSGRATQFALVAMVLIITIATQGLPQKQANRAIIIGAVVMIITVLLDWWIPIPRPVPTVAATPIFAMAIGAVVLAVVVVIRYRTLKLRSKLMVTMMAIPIIIVIIVGSFFIIQITTQLNDTLEEQNLFDGQNKADDIESFLATTESDIRFLSQLSALENYLTVVESEDAEEIAIALALLNEEFKTFSQTRQIYDQIRFLDTTGQEIARVNSKNGLSTIVDASNLQNKSGRYYFDDTIILPSGDLMISPLDLNVEDGEIESPHKPMLRYGTPVVFNGETKGIIVTNVLAQNFLDLLIDDKLPTYLLDGDGYYLYHPDEEKRWGRDLGTNFNINNDAPLVAAPLLAGETGIVNTDTDLLSYQPVTIPGEFSPRWYLLNSMSSTAVLSPITKALAPVQTVLAVTLLLVPIIAILFSQTIAKPIIDITRSAEDVAAGNLDVVLNIDTEDEIGTLANAFNMMTARLRTLVDSLETQVARRTHGLELAAEIGSQLTRITDRRELLETAVDIIGAQFHMYYTQIYLVDALGHTLRLQAGTGEIGKELMLRSHYLPIGEGSINGMAASDKTTIVIEDTRNSPLFRSNELLPYTRSEMAVPLLIGTTLMGTLNIQADQLNQLTKHDIITFNVLASQLAVALQNASLFTETTDAQASIEAQSRRLTHDSWGDYLNAVDRREHIAYRYDQMNTTLIDEELTALDAEQNGIETAVSVNDEEVGLIQLLGRQDHTWTDEERDLVDLVAQQVGQQIENLRLLDETDRYRNEAEQALRRVTRDNWTDFQERSVQTLASGYVYNGNEVSQLAEDADEETADNTAVSKALVVGGQEIGSLAVEDIDKDAGTGTAVLLAQVATQLSSHIETLRLENQTEDALANAQRRSREMTQLNAIVARVSKTLDLTESLRIVAEELVSALHIAQSSITLIDDARENLIIAASYPAGEELEGVIIPIEGNLLTQRVLETRQYVFVPDAQNNPLTAVTHGIFRKQHIQSLAVFPMIIGGNLIGTVGLDIKQANTSFTEDQLQLAETIIAQAATTVQNARLFAQTEEALAEAKRRSEEMATVNRVAQIASRQVDVEPLLQAIYNELRKLMDVGTFHIMLYNADLDVMEYPLIYEQGIRTKQEPLPINPDSYGYHVLQNGEPILENLTPTKAKSNRTRSDLFIGTSDNRETVSLMYTPLRTGQEVTGVLSIQSYQYDAYDEADISLLVSITNYVSVALESARLFEQTRARARQERLLREISERVHTAVDAESVLRTAAREINRSLGLETAVYLDATEENTVTTTSDTVAIISDAHGEQADG